MPRAKCRRYNVMTAWREEHVVLVKHLPTFANNRIQRAATHTRRAITERCVYKCK